VEMAALILVRIKELFSNWFPQLVQVIGSLFGMIGFGLFGRIIYSADWRYINQLTPIGRLFLKNLAIILLVCTLPPCSITRNGTTVT
jgi:hypothetical protein